MVTFQKVRCSKCKAQYLIGWIKFDQDDEYCPNCGEQGGLTVIEEEFKQELLNVKSNRNIQD